MIKSFRLLFLFLLPFIIFTSSCKEARRNKPVVSQSKLPKVKIKIKRYGKALFEADTNHFEKALVRLQKEYPLFLAGDLNDTANYNQLYNYVTDTQIIRIYKKTIEKYSRLDDLEKQLESAFAHLKYYFPNYSIPHVYTYVSDLQFEKPIINTNSVLIIALDDYLGKNFPAYGALNIPRYRAEFMTSKDIVPDVMKTVYTTNFFFNHHIRTLLDRMIEQGKQLYFLDLMMPEVPDTLKIRYTSKQLTWMTDHKQDVWAALIANRLLYTTDFNAIKELTEEGPFTKGFGNKSAPAVGAWFGWQIVSAYMERFPDTKPEQLFRMTDAQKILEKSRYKP